MLASDALCAFALVIHDTTTMRRYRSLDETIGGIKSACLARVMTQASGTFLGISSGSARFPKLYRLWVHGNAEGTSSSDDTDNRSVFVLMVPQPDELSALTEQRSIQNC